MLHEHETRALDKENWWDRKGKLVGLSPKNKREERKKGEREKRKNKMNQACLLLESFKLKVVIVFINSIYL
jgi:hypothetical protein